MGQKAVAQLGVSHLMRRVARRAAVAAGERVVSRRERFEVRRMRGIRWQGAVPASAHGADCEDDVEVVERELSVRTIGLGDEIIERFLNARNGWCGERRETKKKKRNTSRLDSP